MSIATTQSGKQYSKQPAEGSLPCRFVDCIDQSLAKIEQEEGLVIVPKKEMDGLGWFAICQQKNGTVIALLQHF